MNYINRTLEQKLQRLASHFPVVVVTGARQVGKTTLIKHCFENKMKTITFDPVLDMENARGEPEYFLQNNPAPLFLDEIQYAPELLGPLKRSIDKNRENGSYILSGSQNLSVLKDVAESLAGRAAILNLMGMSSAELHGETQNVSFLEQLLTETNVTGAILNASSVPKVFVTQAFKGGYPGLLSLPDDLISEYWASYMQTYIERDVRRVAAIKNLQRFGKFFSLLAALSGCEINFNQLGRELQVDRNTAHEWTEIARATFQWYTVPAYSKNAIKKIAGKEKGYFADTGFLCHLLSIHSPQAILRHPNHGNIFETFVMLEIMKQLQKLTFKVPLYHFRTYSGAEVDCILEHDGELYLIEIKATTQPSKKHTKGFRSFEDCFPRERIAARVIICAVEEPLQISESCIAVPWWMI